MKLANLLLSSVLLGLCSTVYADVVTYAGSSCSPAYGDVYATDTVGSMFNANYNDNLDIFCNIPTVDGQNTINSITIRYVNNNPDFELHCYLRGASSQQVFRSPGPSRSQRTFTFNSTTINNRVPLMLNCTLPKNTSGPAPALIKYTVDIQ
jgi:hypothetical protein